MSNVSLVFSIISVVCFGIYGLMHLLGLWLWLDAKHANARTWLDAALED